MGKESDKSKVETTPSEATGTGSDQARESDRKKDKRDKKEKDTADRKSKSRDGPAPLTAEQRRRVPDLNAGPMSQADLIRLEQRDGLTAEVVDLGAAQAKAMMEQLNTYGYGKDHWKKAIESKKAWEAKRGVPLESDAAAERRAKAEAKKRKEEAEAAKKANTEKDKTSGEAEAEKAKKKKEKATRGVDEPKREKTRKKKAEESKGPKEAGENGAEDPKAKKRRETALDDTRLEYT